MKKTKCLIFHLVYLVYNYSGFWAHLPSKPLQMVVGRVRFELTTT